MLMKQRIFLLLVFLFCFLSLKAQDNIQFKNFTINDGLSQSTVTCVVQDQFGILWLGTQEGINRFDGKNFEVISIDKGYDLGNDNIITSFVDKNNNIWFGSYNGIIKYDSKLVSFKTYSLDFSERLEIHTIKEDNDGNLWIGSAFGKIYKFDVKSEKFILLNDKIFNSTIKDIKFLDDKVLLISEFEGILVTDYNFKYQRIINPKLEEGSYFLLNKFINIPDRAVAVVTDKGAFYLNIANERFTPLGGLYDEVNNHNIKDALSIDENRVIMATENDGIFLVSKNLNDSINISHYTADIFQKGALISNMIYGLFKDNQGVIWIYSNRGISSYNPNFLGFRGVSASKDLSKGLPSQNVWGFAESSDGNNLYIAADHGISNYDRKKHVFYHYYREFTGNDDYTTLCIRIVKKNHFLVGSIDGFFELVVDSNNPNIYEYHKIEYPESIQRGFDLVYTIIPFKDKEHYLIGTRGGVILFNYITKKLQFLSSSDSPNSIGAGPCRVIFSHKDNYYVAPSSGGLYKVDLINDSLVVFKNHDFSTLNQISNSYFSSVMEMNNSIFWFSTMGDGLFKFDLNSKKVVHYDKSKGLPNGVIYGVKASDKGSDFIWLSTNKGVIGFNTKTEKFYSFTDKDGLLSNELNSGASFVSKNGQIYFGGIQGYNYFYPQESFYFNYKIKVFFSGIEVDNKNILPEEHGLLTENIAFTKRINLSYDKRSIKLKFFVDDLSNSDRVEYKYILRGSNDVEEELGNNNEIRFNSLAPGTYELFIYARLPYQEWGNEPAHIIIDVERPYWQTWWFYTIILVVIFLFVLYRVRKNIDEERRQQVRLEMLISDRTRELRKKNEQIEEQREKLILQTEELEREKEKSERLLNNVLPRETASQLKKDGHSTAREFSKVSILFTDFVGFSKIAESMPASDLVAILDMHFRKFDEIIEKNDLEKIKTIGDAYMAAGGVPIRNKTNPINTTLAAVQIKYYMLQHKVDQIKKGEPYWKLRIGINTGPVYAGVIGAKRYAYDVWGNTVNKAQRMEGFCEPEKIAVTEDTFNYIEPYFECNPIGKVEMKSGNKIMMYEVVCIKPELSIGGLGIEPNDAFDKLVTLHHFSKINYYKAERFILAKLKKELSPKLHYHSYIHSKDVTRQVERIAIEEGITDEDLFLLKSAASYHDAGFVEQYEHNEPIGARMAAEILPRFGYSEAHIQRIKELIFVTEVPHHPQNKLEEIICDADLDYLGRDDFHEIADRLRRELREYGKINSDRKWDEMQVIFLEKHRYFTETALRTRLEKKKQNIEEIKQRLERNDYVD